MILSLILCSTVPWDLLSLIWVHIIDPDLFEEPTEELCCECVQSHQECVSQYLRECVSQYLRECVSQYLLSVALLLLTIDTVYVTWCCLCYLMLSMLLDAVLILSLLLDHDTVTVTGQSLFGCLLGRSGSKSWADKSHQVWKTVIVVGVFVGASYLSVTWPTVTVALIQYSCSCALCARQWVGVDRCCVCMYVIEPWISRLQRGRFYRSGSNLWDHILFTVALRGVHIRSGSNW